MKFNRAYVLAPFHQLMSDCQKNVELGLKMVEYIDSLSEQPAPDSPLHISFRIDGERPPQGHNLEETKTKFRQWVLLKGFEDVHKSIRTALEKLYVLKTVERELAADPKINVSEREKAY